VIHASQTRFGSSAFTLIELLVVTGTIAILSAIIISTLNPIEISNRARDSAMRQDAGALYNAYQRYAVNNQSYPWMDIDNSQTVATTGDAWFGRSDDSGAGLCSAPLPAGPDVQCDQYNSPGLIIQNMELKESFLSKGYTSMETKDPHFDSSENHYLWIDKKSGLPSRVDDTYICFIPKAKVNRLSSANLKRPILNIIPPQRNCGQARKNKNNFTLEIISFEPTTSRDFVGIWAARRWDFKTPETSLFICIP